MRVDFYRLTRDPAARVVPVLADRILAGGARALVVAGEDGLRAAISEALWAHRDDAFLAHGPADGELARLDPILLAREPLVPSPNGATMIILADGVWREAALDFARSFFLFDNSRIDDARATWRTLGQRSEIERHFWKQDERGRWAEGS